MLANGTQSTGEQRHTVMCEREPAACHVTSHFFHRSGAGKLELEQLFKEAYCG
eukprot:SAG11_NODE_15068_length_590_cov_0.947047_2_plen_52_part_01